MATKQLVTFQDIYEAVLEELKYQSSDTASVERIKRDINTIYINEVAEYSRWKWMDGNTTVRMPAAYSGGTASVSSDSSTITLSDTPATSLGSFLNFSFSVEGETEIYTVTAHTAGSTSITLDRTFNGTTNSAANFKIWREWLGLPTDADDVIEARHNLTPYPLDGLGWPQKFRRTQQRSPKASGAPQVYSVGDYYDPTPLTAEEEADRYRKLYIHPAIYTANVNINIDYKKEVTALVDDDDEPLMPIGDRIVLLYGALSRAWTRERNPESAASNFNLFQNKLARMAGKMDGSTDMPSVKIGGAYISSKRARAGAKQGAGNLLAGFGAGAGGFTDVKFLSDVTISGATLTDNMTVQTGVTIDGRDVSEDGGTLDAHIAATDSVHGVTGNVVGTSDTQTLTNKTIDADNNTISNLAHGAEVDDPSSGVHGVSGSVVGTSDAQTLTNKTIDANNNTISNLAHGAEVDNPSSGVHGVTGDVVGTTDTQTLTAKTIDADNNTISNLAHGAEVDNPSSGVHGVTGDVVGTTDTQTLSSKTLTSPVLNTSVSGTAVLDEDNMASDSDTQLATQQSIKAYADTKITAPSSTDNAVARFDGTSGALQDSGVIVDDSNQITGVGRLDVDATTRIDSDQIVTISGTGNNLRLGSDGGEIHFLDGADLKMYNTGAQAVTVAVPDSTVTDYTITLPAAAPTVTGQVLKDTDGAGTLEWGDAGGDGGINYIENGKFEADASGWSTYADAAGTSPVDGAGGSPTVTFTRNTTTPLRGTGDGKFTKDAANRQGEGVAVDVTIDEADKNSLLYLFMDIDASDADYADGDLRFYVISSNDSFVADFNVISPADPEIKGGKYRYINAVQVDSNTDVRVVFHVASTNAAAYDVLIDNVRFGPLSEGATKGAVVTDWESFTPTHSDNTNIDVNAGQYRRVGDSLEVTLLFTWNGAGAGSNHYVELPGGFTIDSSKIPNSDTTDNKLGEATWENSGTSFESLSVVPNGTNRVRFVEDDANNYWDGTQAASGDKIFARYKVPIAGWSSNAKQSVDFGNQRIAGRYNTNTSQNFDSGDEDPMIFEDLVYVDGPAAYDTSTGDFTAPQSGWYDFDVMATWTNIDLLEGESYYIALRVDGTVVKRVQFEANDPNTSNNNSMCISDCLKLSKGQVVDVVIFQNTGTQQSTVGVDIRNVFSYAKRSDPETQLGNQVVDFRATSNSGAAIGTSFGDYVFEDEVEDSHNSYDASTGEFTAPYSGTYHFSWQIGMDPETLSTTQRFLTAILIDGSIEHYGSRSNGNGASTSQYSQGSVSLRLNKGQVVKIQADSDIATNGLTAAGVNYFSGHKVN